MFLNQRLKRQLLLLCMCCISLSMVRGQDRILNFRNTPVSKAVTEIQKIYGYSVVVKPDGLDMNREITLSLVNEDIEKALEMIFSGQNVEIEISGKSAYVNKVIEPERTTPIEDSRIEIKGIVLDETGTPLIGASVLISGSTSDGTVTDLDGAYMLNAPQDAVLLFSFIGYKTSEIPVGGRTTINVTLRPDSEFLEATVVVGYGTQKKVNLSGAVSAVNLEETSEHRAVTNLSSGLQGISSGLLAQQSSGEPGADEATVTIRGLGTLNNS